MNLAIQLEVTGDNVNINGFQTAFPKTGEELTVSLCYGDEGAEGQFEDLSYLLSAISLVMFKKGAPSPAQQPATTPPPEEAKQECSKIPQFDPVACKVKWKFKFGE